MENQEKNPDFPKAPSLGSQVCKGPRAKQIKPSLALMQLQCPSSLCPQMLKGNRSWSGSFQCSVGKCNSIYTHKKNLPALRPEPDELIGFLLVFCFSFPPFFWQRKMPDLFPGLS